MGSEKQIILDYTERLSDKGTPDPLGDTIIIAEKDFKDFEPMILNIHESFCWNCNARLNRLDQKYPFCHDPMPEDPLLITFLSSKKIRAFREAVLDLLLSYKYITHEQMMKEANKFNLTREQFIKIVIEMINKGDLFNSVGGRYKAINK